MASTASLANKLEAIVASGLPSAISETYGQPGNPLTADKVLQFLQGKPSFCLCGLHLQLQGILVLVFCRSFDAVEWPAVLLMFL